MKAFINILEAKASGKFFAAIDIHGKFFNEGIATIKSKEFASRKVCINKAEEFCSTVLCINNYKVIDDTEKQADKKGGKKIGKK